MYLVPLKQTQLRLTSTSTSYVSKLFFLPFSNIFLLHSLLPSIFKVRIYRSINIKYKYVNVWFMSFGQGVECQNWCWMSNICYCELTQKRSYLGICTSFRSDFHVLKKSKQTFNIKFVIRRPVQMTWTRHKPIFCQSVSNLC